MLKSYNQKLRCCHRCCDFQQQMVLLSLIFSFHAFTLFVARREVHRELCRIVLICFLATKAAITIAIRLRFSFDSTTTKNEHVHFFVASRGVVANKKAVVGAYNDVIVYITVIIRMACTDQHRVASFDCRCWYSPFTHFRSKMSSGLNHALIKTIGVQ